MKKIVILITLLVIAGTCKVLGQSGNSGYVPTSVGIVIYSNDVETIWNAFRFANYSKEQGDTVSVFLLGKGVELDSIVKKKVDLKDQTEMFLEKGGVILGCGTCLASRKISQPQVCLYSSMSDLYAIVRKSKVLLTF